MSFTDIIKQKSKDWKAPHLMDSYIASRGEKIPFSSPLLNWSTYGGIPRYKMSEFFGEPGGGKSTTAMDICKNGLDIFEQEWEERLVELREHCDTKEKKLELAELEEVGPRKVLYLDLEHSFDKKWSETLGIDTERIHIMQPPDISAEKMLQTVNELVATDELGLIVLDSIPSLVTQAELDKKYGERTVASLAGLLTIFCRKITPLLTKYKTTLLVINQTRVNMDNPWKVNTPGGEALKFHCCLRIQFSIANPIDIMGTDLAQKTEDPAGYKVATRIHKQKSAPNDRRNASYLLLCDRGISPLMDYGKLAIDQYGFIKKAAGWFTICDPYTGEIYEDENGNLAKVNGQVRVYEYLEDHPEYYEIVKKFIEEDINGGDDEDEDEEDLPVDDVDAEEDDLSIEVVSEEESEGESEEESKEAE